MKVRSLPLLLLMCAAMAQAQQSGIRRTVIEKGDVAATGRQAVVARVELDEGASAGRHSHPGDEIGYVLEGEAELLIHGEDPRRLKPGQAYIIPAGTIHDARNVGKGTARLVGVFVVEKDKPLAIPAR
ncbi:cupin domain-containing protein [Oxalobacteraceae bacterium A2-2]